jgi:Ca2+-binding RTX toxin-like protein
MRHSDMGFGGGRTPSDRLAFRSKVRAPAVLVAALVGLTALAGAGGPAFSAAVDGHGATATVAATPAAGGVPRCFGRAATRVVRAEEVIVAGTTGADVIVGSAGRDRVVGRGGNDRICTGGDGDKVVAGFGRDLVDGGEGNDRLRGGQGKDFLDGRTGRDTLASGPNQGLLRGGPGDDVLVAPGPPSHPRAQFFVCATYAGSPGPLTVDLRVGERIDPRRRSGEASGAGVGTDRLLHVNCVIGTRGDDVMVGGPNSGPPGETFEGGAGDDDLRGLPGRDFLDGGDGDDRIDGGVGRDNARGGPHRTGDTCLRIEFRRGCDF